MLRDETRLDPPQRACLADHNLYLPDALACQTTTTFSPGHNATPRSSKRRHSCLRAKSGLTETAEAGYSASGVQKVAGP